MINRGVCIGIIQLISQQLNQSNFSLLFLSFYQNCYHYYHFYILSTDYYILSHLLTWSGRLLVPKFLGGCAFWIETHCFSDNFDVLNLMMQTSDYAYKSWLWFWSSMKGIWNLKHTIFKQLSCAEFNDAKSDSGHFDCMAIVFLCFSMIQNFTCDF